MNFTSFPVKLICFHLLSFQLEGVIGHCVGFDVDYNNFLYEPILFPFVNRLHLIYCLPVRSIYEFYPRSTALLIE